MTEGNERMFGWKVGRGKACFDCKGMEVEEWLRKRKQIYQVGNIKMNRKNSYS